ncbi:MAG: hypothetical protein ABSF70_17815 [Terracidiphilus sp.]|jgi:hypothetical protein
MKKILFVILILSSTLAWGKPKPEEYTVTVHVQSSGLALTCDYIFGRQDCESRQHLYVVIDGKKYEMISGDYPWVALVTGDYKAKRLPDNPDDNGGNPPNSYEYHQRYEFLFPDGKTRKYIVVGGSE